MLCTCLCIYKMVCRYLWIWILANPKRLYILNSTSYALLVWTWYLHCQLCTIKVHFRNPQTPLHAWTLEYIPKLYTIKVHVLEITSSSYIPSKSISNLNLNVFVPIIPSIFKCELDIYIVKLYTVKLQVLNSTSNPLHGITWD